jgi:hypothetical protein
MTPQKIRDHLALAKAIGAVLMLRIQARVGVECIEEPGEGSGFGLGLVHLKHMLMFVPKDHEDGEGWEYHCEKEGSSLAGPTFRLDDGSELSLAQAKKVLEEKKRVETS